MRLTSLVVVIGFLLPLTGLAQLSPTAIWAVESETRYQFYPNVMYTTENGIEMQLDIYSRRDVNSPQPTLVFFHGGFWMAGSKETQLTALLPWLEMGWNVVNVEYRLGNEALAPAAVVDSFCAMRFINTEAERFNIDVNRLVTSGQSAGGHLALAMAMIPAEEGFGASCPAGEMPEVAAVINWYGVTDVTDVISGPNRSDFAAGWFGEMPDALELAQRLSPLHNVRNGLPPILTIQGDADNVVPYQEGVDLHAALAETDVVHRLLTIPGGGHGRFSAAERRSIYETIGEFLKDVGL
ncbi:alpha/beta hydrolase [Gammaproteobacteria bacterium]|nr:alpha/beta hydrolase [Gammaproteobacteria bacterium]